MDITTLHLDQNSLANGGELLLVEIRPVRRYVDGKASEDFDYRCAVVAPKNGFNRFEVVVTEKPAFEVPAEGAVSAVFTGLSVKIYRKFNDASTGYGLSCRAQSVAPVKKA